MANDRVCRESNFDVKVKRVTKEKEWKLNLILIASQNNKTNDEVLSVCIDTKFVVRYPSRLYTCM